MNFPKIYDKDELIGIVVNLAKKTTDKTNIIKYISAVQIAICDRLEKIEKELPDHDKMNRYYYLMSVNIAPENTIKKYINHYKTTISLINKISEKFKQRALRANKQDIASMKTEYIGRIASLLKKLESTNKALISLSPDFKRIANPKSGLFTIALVGSPNSGKTTTLKALTKSAPEINSYAFTTKALNMGYFQRRQEIIQVIDTPGLIHLEFKEMNAIEKQTITAIKTLADVVVFMYNEYDDLATQESLLNSLKNNNLDKKIFALSTYGKSMPNIINLTLDKILKKDFS